LHTPTPRHKEESSKCFNFNPKVLFGEETARVALAAFPKGNLYITMRDEMGTLYSDQDFQALLPMYGQPAECPWRLALACVMQYIEELSDRLAE
jgi:transposase